MQWVYIYIYIYVSGVGPYSWFKIYVILCVFLFYLCKGWFLAMHFRVLRKSWIYVNYKSNNSTCIYIQICFVVVVYLFVFDQSKCFHHNQIHFHIKYISYPWLWYAIDAKYSMLEFFLFLSVLILWWIWKIYKYFSKNFQFSKTKLFRMDCIV